MPTTRRYQPEWAPGEACLIGLDFSPIIPVGVGIASGALNIFLNSAGAPPADSDFVVGPIQVRGRAIYAMVSGGSGGIDYIFRWVANDTDGNVWPRTTLLLCANTS